MPDERELVLLDERVDESVMVAAVDGLGSWPTLALDTEADSFHRYFEKVCLIQISTPHADVIFDPLAHGLPEPLRRVLEAASRTIVLHGADYDVLSLKRSFQLGLGKVFDTMIAARFLGIEAVGLKALLERELGVHISKGEQRSDWGRRPLSDAQIGYARQDTAHLLELAERLRAQLEERGRLSWVEEECELLRRRSPVEKPFDPAGWLKISGAKQLPELGQRALRAGYLWREEVAQKKDRPPFKILGNDVLLAIARDVADRGAEGLAGLAQRRGIPRGLDVRGLAGAIRAAIADRTVPLERPAVQKSAPPGEAARAQTAKLRAAREGWVKALGIDAGVLFPQSLIDLVAREMPSTFDALAALPGMTRWRVEAFGQAILDLRKGTV
ncbi:MAG: HRDC domain-containing protein [Deltaproteobacteria bacterium]|nr:HRDC domain-containing protein [Deltaproteobacteria bacterium]